MGRYNEKAPGEKGPKIKIYALEDRIPSAATKSIKIVVNVS